MCAIDCGTCICVKAKVHSPISTNSMKINKCRVGYLIKDEMFLVFY